MRVLAGPACALTPELRFRGKGMPGEEKRGQASWTGWGGGGVGRRAGGAQGARTQAGESERREREREREREQVSWPHLQREDEGPAAAVVPDVEGDRQRVPQLLADREALRLRAACVWG